MRISKLDGLRGIFSLMVVFYHYNENVLPSNILNNFFVRESYYAVDFFFVLSGFVISYNYYSINTISSFFNYLRKRFARLYPLLLYTTTIFFLIDMLFNYYFPHYISSVNSFLELLTKYFDSIFFTNSTPILGNTTGENPPSWSISAEMIAYLFFGITTLFTVKNNRSLIFLMITLIAVVFSITNNMFSMFEGDFSFARGIISFNIGYFVWVFSKKKFKINNGVEFLLPIILFALFFLSFKSLGLIKIILQYIVIPLFFGLSILTFIKTNGLFTKLLDTKCLKFLGDISYSIYLNHYIVLMLVPKGFFTILKMPQTIHAQVLVLLFTLTAIILYSIFTYKIIELKGGLFLKKSYSLKKT